MHILILSLIFLSSCASWDSRIFTPTKKEVVLQRKIRKFSFYDKPNKCKKIGSLKLNDAEKGRPAKLVALRKYPEADAIQMKESRTDGGINGEFPAVYYDVFNCRI